MTYTMSISCNHSSRNLIAKILKRSCKSTPCEKTDRVLFSCFKWGLQRQGITTKGLDLKPNIFILSTLQKMQDSGLFSVALSVALRPPVFHWHLFSTKSRLSSLAKDTLLQQRLHFISVLIFQAFAVRLLRRRGWVASPSKISCSSQ